MDSVGAGFAWGGAVAAAAIVTIILMTPYAQQFAKRGTQSTVVASSDQNVAPASNQVANAATNEPTMADNDSHADISRLESANHSVAVWSEPRRDTTVIWLPDQP